MMLMMMLTRCLLEFPTTFLIPKKLFWEINKTTMGTIINHNWNKGTKQQQKINQDFLFCHFHEIKKHVLLVPTTVPVTTRTNKNIQKQIIYFHHCPFLHPLDKFVELFKPNIVILMATPHCFDLNLFLWDNGTSMCLITTTT